MNIEQMTDEQISAFLVNDNCYEGSLHDFARAILAARDAQWNALIAGQAGEAVAWRYRFHTDDSLAGKPNVRGWVLTDIRPPTRSGDIEVEPLFAAPVAQPATEQAEAPSDTLRVACITLDGSTLYIPAKCITDFGIGDDDGETYALTFKTMTRAEYEALGEFDGF